MKIAILTSGILPVPAVQGGAVENLIDFYLEYNNIHKLHDITVISAYHKDVEKLPVLSTDVNHYEYIDTTSIYAKVKKHLRHLLYKKQEYYDYSVEYYLYEAIKRLRRDKYDAIIIENRPGFALKVPHSIYKRIIYHLHNDHLSTKNNRFMEIYDVAECIICVSDYIKNRVKTISPTDKKAITIYNGIDVERFNRPVYPINRQKLGFSDKDFIAIFTGRIVSGKGIRELIKTMCLLKEHPHIKLLVLGTSFLGNNQGHSPFVEELKQLSNEIKDNIIFTGYVDYELVPSYLHLANIAVVPSVWEEPFGLTCIEALAAGLPLITTNRGGIPEITRDDCCITLNVDDSFVDNLADAILSLSTDNERCLNMGKAAATHVMQFNKDYYASNFFKAIEP